MKRFPAVLLWTLPALFCLAVFWPGLMAWFQSDDFAWLGLKLEVWNLRDLAWALFAPMAQGTIRPLSERAFFLAGEAVFGVRALPFHAWVFLTQMASLALLGAITLRVTKSRLAAVLAPLFWTANVALAVPMSWAAAYNQVLCGFFLLLALYSLMRWVETGSRRFWIAQWIAFVAGFGALETNAVYPAIAAVYLACTAPKLAGRIAPLFLVSGGYAALRYWLAGAGAADPAYAVAVDARVLHTLSVYWRWVLGAARLPEFLPELAPAWIAAGGTAVFSAAFGALTLWKLWRREWAVMFPWAWFVLTLAPFLALPNHRLDYYLALPVAGLALLAAWGVAEAWRRGWSWRIPAVALAGAFLVVGAFEANRGATYSAERSVAVRSLVWATIQARQLNPGKAILLAGVDSDLFGAALAHRPFRLLGVRDVYLAPEAAGEIRARPELLAENVLPAPIAMRMLAEGRAVVYQVAPDRLKAVTLTYFLARKQAWSEPEPRRVDVGKPSFAAQLGPVWHAIADGYRWMARSASVRLGGPRSRLEKLYISGYCPAPQVKAGPLNVTFSLDGKALSSFRLEKGDAPFRFVLPLPASAVGKERVEVGIAVDRTIRPPPDTRELGLVFGTFEIRE